ncbi:phage/plasmid primase, P4 family [Caulobacter sp. BP25]|uniref:DNA primase family protein n=1 Tax=Caulobacter sp. BP25 TaxID=2048900 RepID=UPI0013747AAC|nr:phage/plasmid primase, P4 family [Caulobacter sp. BP25]
MEVGVGAGELAHIQVLLGQATGLEKPVLTGLTRDARNTIRPFGVISSYEAAAKAYSSVLDGYASPEGDLAGVVFAQENWNIFDQSEGYYVHVSKGEITKDLVEKLRGSWTVKTERDQREVVRRLVDRYEIPRFFDDAAEGLPTQECFVRFDASARALIAEPLARSHKARFRVDVALSRTAAAPRFLAGLERVLPDPRKRQALQEFVGCLALRVTPWQDCDRRMAILWGPGGSGKSTFIEVARSLLPPELVASVPPKTWGDEFSRARLEGVWLNYCTELAGNQLIATDILKQVLSGETVTARHRYGQEREIRPIALHVVATNELPRISDSSGALDRRLLVIHFDQALSQAEMDGRFLKSLREERPGIIAWAAEGAERLMSRGHFELPPGHAEAMLRMKFGDDIVSLFAHTQLERAPDHRVTSADLRAALANYAVEQGHDRAVAAGSGPMRRLSSLMEVNYGAKRSASNNAPFYTGVALKRPPAPQDAETGLEGL